MCVLDFAGLLAGLPLMPKVVCIQAVHNKPTNAWILMVALIVCGISAPGNFTSRLTPEVIGWTLSITCSVRILMQGMTLRELA